MPTTDLQTPSITALPPGSRVSEYVIESVLGFGGFGITYKAIDSKDRLHSVVAVKEYFPWRLAARQGEKVALASQQDGQRRLFQDGLRRFFAEAELLSHIHHPAVVKILRLLEQNGTGYMIMEHMPGQTLQQQLENQRDFSETNLKRMFVPVLEAIHHLHGQHILHRDIKPHNLYVRENGEAMLLDFGSARRAFTKHTALVTPGYAPFEQYHSEDPGPWIDIYSLGATLYSCINAGNPPPESITRVAHIQAGQDDPLRPAIRLGDSRYSKEFLQSIDSMLSIDPEARPKSVQHIIDAWVEEPQISTIAPINTSPTLLPNKERIKIAAEDRSFKIKSSREEVRRRSRTWPYTIAGMVTLSIILTFVWYGQHRTTPTDMVPTPLTENLSAETPKLDAPISATGVSLEGVRQPTPAGKVKQGQVTSKSQQKDEAGEKTSKNTPKSDTPPAGHPSTPQTRPKSVSSIESTLQIQSDPTGAVVFINGIKKGQTPLESPMTWAVGKEQIIKLSKAGYSDWQHRLRPAGPKTYEIKAVMSPIPVPKPPKKSQAEATLDPIPEALAGLYRTAKAGDPDAQYNLALMYDNGGRIGQNDQQALYWYQRAAEQGHIEAQANLAYFYEQGRGAAPDSQKAFHWYRQAAQAGSSGAQYHVATMYLHSNGVAKDEHKAFSWMQHSAKQGNIQAQTTLGLMYAKGQGVGQNHHQAVKWWRQAAHSGDATAQFQLGQANEHGRGTPKSYRKAFNWYTKAALQGNNQAQFSLGLMYAKGKGIRRQRAQALRWYRRAAANGNANAKAIIKKQITG